ncbi:PilN domain-containing protein [Nocardioides sp. GXZ039]|uniref:PilN domain-containing protein n=1 Tax=Nocardioides sp. GXZ039 TaxID=3136018 RepID=UPI0030F3A840
MSKLLPTLTKDRDTASAAKSERPTPGRRRATPISASVNLLSPWVFEEMRVRNLRQRFIVAGIVVLVILAATWGLMRFTLANAKDDLRKDEAAAVELQRQINELGDVKVYVGNVTIRGKDVAEMMAYEVSVSKALDALAASLPNGAKYTSVKITLPENPLLLPPNGSDATGPVCPGPDPFDTLDSVGCIEVTGEAKSRADVADMINALSKESILAAPFVGVTNTNENNEGNAPIEFSGSAAISKEGLTGRYDELAPGGSADPASDSTGAEGEN